MPGDVVLGRNGGVIFIPPQLAEQVVKYSERTHLEDMFGHQRLQREKIHRWTDRCQMDTGNRTGLSPVAERE